MEILVIIIGICVAICALAMLFQLWIWVALAASAMRIRNAVSEEARRLAAVRATFMPTVPESRDEIKHIAASAKDLFAVLKREKKAVMETSSDAMHRYRVERERVEVVYNDIKHRVETTAEVMEDGIARPWREAIGLLRGVEPGHNEGAPQDNPPHRRAA